MILQILDRSTLERCITLYGVSWEQLEIIESTLEVIAGVRLTYLDGTFDIIAPLSPEHEDLKKHYCLIAKNSPNKA